MKADEQAARLAAADELAQLGKRMAADLATILRTARSLIDPAKEIGRSVCTLKRYGGNGQMCGREALEIATALERFCATPKGTRLRAEAKRQADRARFEKQRADDEAEFEALRREGVPEGELWLTLAERQRERR